MDPIPVQPPPLPVKRPPLVWVISFLYFGSVAWSMLSFLFIFSHVVPVNPVQEAYFKSQGVLDYGLSFVVGALNLIGAITLFRLMKSAFIFFLTAFCIAFVFALYHFTTTNWLSVVVSLGIV